MSGEQQRWDDAMARWDGLVDAAAERARRRDMFAAAALTGILASQDEWRRVAAAEAVRHADEVLAALDATAVPTSVSVPPSPATRPGEAE